jgi:hypothetical protein
MPNARSALRQIDFLNIFCVTPEVRVGQINTTKDSYSRAYPLHS